ncbi:S-layer homology domain-containing protein [Peptoniphilus asaccharolyticus DSM 20463]|uniref:S-layer homology domain-containing protein n=1 Tax=Peptoniphilus asaccharolyticus DSM 20463 TaxID=573058 RepID=A0A1W1UGF5_PEPAS|nr:S-layer homology domain-containing protein [Peptoniphilus asaccharolyticus]MBL7574686.1 S-layer homology domain-containing protein [Peptoniphilus asaccharolyticus]SMB80167.1 S-layer homology domain-containing protein [Peptoniphilus asaccharolyticus DSM 20463]
MQTNKITKALSVGLCAVVLAPSLVSAKEFKDVAKNGPHSWAYGYIDELSDKGIINGYPNGEFQPNNSVSLEETVELIKGLLSPSGSEIASARAKYRAILEDAKVPEWARDAFAIAIENNVFSEATVKEAASKGFIGEGKNKLVPDRNTIAVYFARALKLSATGDETFLRHEDKSSIPSATRGYLANLVKEGIFSSTGSDGRFEGTRSIRRSEMAKITKLSYDYLKLNKNKTPELANITGKIVIATNISNVDTVIIEQSNKSTIQLKVNSNTKITSNGTTLKFTDLKPDQEVKVTYQKAGNEATNNVITTIEVTNSAKNLVGYITNRAQDGFTAKYRTDDGKVDTSSVSQISTTDTATFTLANNAKVYSLGVETRANQLQIDDLVEFKTDNSGKVSEVVAYPRNGRATGEITEIFYGSTSSREYIKLKLQDGKTYTFYGTELNRNNPFYNNSRLFDNLRRGERITLSTNYKVVTNVGNDYRNGQNLTGRIERAYEERNGFRLDIRTFNRTIETVYTDRYTEYRENGVGRTQLTTRDFEGREVSVVRDNGSYVRKLEFLREGANFAIRARVDGVRTDGAFGQAGLTYFLRVEDSNNNYMRNGDTFELSTTYNNGKAMNEGERVDVIGTRLSNGEWSVSEVRSAYDGRIIYGNFYSRGIR